MRRFDPDIRNTKGNEQVLPNLVFLEIVAIFTVKAVYDGLIDEFALPIPHEFLYSQLRKTPITLLDLIMSGDEALAIDPGRTSIIRMLGGHRGRNLPFHGEKTKASSAYQIQEKSKRGTTTEN